MPENNTLWDKPDMMKNTYKYIYISSFSLITQWKLLMGEIIKKKNKKKYFCIEKVNKKKT